VTLEGKVLATPGRVLVAEFDGMQKQNRREAGELFSLESVQQTGDGIQVSVACPATKRLASARTPQDRMQALISERGSYTAEIEDSAGQVQTVSRVPPMQSAGIGGTLGL
jgi:hypothetical protein